MATTGAKEGKDGTERRVYVLPTELLDRIRAYQSAHGIASEVEAVRRLLDSALQMRDSVIDVLNKLSAKFNDEHDLRMLVRDVLSTHPLVQDIKIEETSLEFKLKNGACGTINSFGLMKYHEPNEDYFKDWPPKKGVPRPTTKPVKTEMDDEIPF